MHVLRLIFRRIDIVRSDHPDARDGIKFRGIEARATPL